MEVLDVPLNLRKTIELKLINKQIFDLLQEIQSNRRSIDEKQKCLETIQQISRSLDSKL
jgi:hypothetical protein